MKRLVIFDLDGTLLDTIDDLAASTNHALRDNGLPMHDTAAYKHFVGNGIMKLIERAMPASKVNDASLARMRASFLAHYDRHNCDLTRPYDGITAMLHALADKGIGMAVASNKYDSAVKRIIGHYFPDIPFIAAEGNKEGVAPKPDPAIVLGIMAAAGCAKGDVLYVGDSGVDMQTAANAGVEACGVTWGFRPVDELRQFAPQHIVSTPAEIVALATGDAR
ncbi:MAG TPA: HAD family hydrolase [Candidatus Avibacteroides faecavium]|nr:HAD family hydrolase [Candidatus Avibacteroides faecavium]